MKILFKTSFFFFLFISTHVFSEVPLKLIPLSAHTYYVRGLSELGSKENQNFISNAGVIVGDQGVIVVDALGSPPLSEVLITQIQKITNKPIVAVVLTHYHADHVYGLENFKKLGSKIIAHEQAKSYVFSDSAQSRLQAYRKEFYPWFNESTQLVQADEWLSKDTIIRLGNVTLKLMHMGPAHTKEDLVIYVEEDKVLFAGDLFFSKRIPYVGNANTIGWLKILEKLQKMPIDIAVPGHGDFSNTPLMDFNFTYEYVKYLREKLYQAARDMDDFDATYQSIDWGPYEKVPLFKPANRLNAYNVFISMQNE